MAHLTHKHYDSWHHHASIKDLLRYTAIAVVAVLGIAGLLQSIAGSSQTSSSVRSDTGITSVYGQ